MCYIIFTSNIVYVASSVHGGLRGGGGGDSAKPPLGGLGGSSHEEKQFFLRKPLTDLGGFSTHSFFVDGFIFSVKELGFLTNLGHWVRGLDATRSYMYILL
jgi:hypothetical protein